MSTESASVRPGIRRNWLKKLEGAILGRPWWQQVLLMILISFLVIQFFGMLSMKILVPTRGLQQGADIPEIRGIDGIQANFVRWDAGYYLSIVRNGYTTDGPERAFYPLYPLLVAGLSWLLGIQVLWSGLIISTLCFAATSLMLYRWITIDYPVEVARWSVLWFCVFPTTFFLIAFYSEPLLLLTIIGTLYFARCGNFLASGACIALAGATRSYAFLLAVPYIVEFIYQRKFDRRSWLKFIAGALIAPLGTVAYFIFLAIKSRNYDLLAIQRSSTQAWASQFHLAWPWITWIDGIRAALFGAQIIPGWFTGWFYRATVLQDLAFALFGLLISIWAVLHLRPYISGFLVASVLFFSFNHGPGGFASIPRHIGSLVPICLVLALLTLKIPGRLRWLPVALSVALLGILSIWFVRGGWVS